MSTAHDETPGGEGLPVITDDFMRAAMQTEVRPFVLAMLKQGPAYGTPGSDAVIWEHGRRNFALRASGVLSIVMPIADDTQWCGIGIFDADEAEVARILDGDPAIRAGVLEYEIHPGRSFRGDRLPG